MVSFQVCDDVKLLHTELDSIKTQLKVPGGEETLGNVVGIVSDKLDSLVESAQKSNEVRRRKFCFSMAISFRLISA